MTELESIVAKRMKEDCDRHALELMEQAVVEANKSINAGQLDTLVIISLLRAANAVRRVGRNALIERK